MAADVLSVNTYYIPGQMADVVDVYRPIDAVDGADVRPICSPYIGI